MILSAGKALIFIVNEPLVLISHCLYITIDGIRLSQDYAKIVHNKLKRMATKIVKAKEKE